MDEFNVSEQLGYNINRVTILIRRELTSCLKDYHMTPEQWLALATLWKHKSMSQTQIASVTLQDLPAVSRMIKRMVNNGLVTKEKSKDSERTNVIGLTKKGLQLEKVLPEKLSAHFKPIWEKFPEKKRNLLRDLLVEFREVLDDHKI